MIRIVFLAVIIGVVGIVAATTYVLTVQTADEVQPLVQINNGQRIRDFFKPAPKRDLTGSQEMRPRW